ncbi:MAG: ABC transporter permease [Deltaproteobacteria bacterium]|nr:ABC transporter permease [Deltaproteobacteria bacterium]
MSRELLVFSPARVAAMVLRYYYLLRNSWPRLVELIYWPTVQMIMWGFITKFFVSHSDWLMQAAGVLISGVLLWDVLYRGQLGVSLMFFEEMYARNLGNLFVSPLRPLELVAALLTVSLLRTLLSFSGAALLALLLYRYNIFTLGLPLTVFFFNLLIWGWSIGLLVCSLVLRYGIGAESLAWVAIFAVAPFSGIYYPVATLPDWLQPLAWLLPASHVFEGMRALMIQGVFRVDLIINAGLLNLAYLLLSLGVFGLTFRAARRRGLLLNVGE